MEKCDILDVFIAGNVHHNSYLKNIFLLFMGKCGKMRISSCFFAFFQLLLSAKNEPLCLLVDT